MNYNLTAGYGQLLAMQIAAAVGPSFGKILVVMEDSDNAYTQNMVKNMFTPDPDGRVRFFATIDAAVDAAITNANDVILLSANTTHLLSSGLAVSKNRIHFIGMDGGDRLQAQGAKIQLATAATSAYVMINTGNRNSFRNIKFIQAATANTGLHVVEEGGEGTLYKNCSFVFGVADNLDLTTAFEFVCGSDSGTYIDCTFGAATLTTSAARATLIYDAVTGGATTPRDNVFRRCIFTIESSSADSLFVKMAASGDAKGINLFDDCSFIAALVNGGGIALTKAVTTANGLTDGIFCYAYPRCFNVTNFGVNGTNNDNLYVTGPVVTGTDIVAIQAVAT